MIYSDELFNEICVVMVHISIKDPLWEVKTFSYDFWGCVVQKCIEKSCELINIEKLNDNLVKLSDTGCLNVSLTIENDGLEFIMFLYCKYLVYILAL